MAQHKGGRRMRYVWIPLLAMLLFIVSQICVIFGLMNLWQANLIFLCWLTANEIQRKSKNA